MRSQPSPAFTIHSKWSIKAVKLVLKDVRVQEVLAFCSGHLITKTTASLYITFDKHNFQQLKKLQIFIILQEVTTISVDKPKHKHSYLCKIIDIYVYIYNISSNELFALPNAWTPIYISQVLYALRV